MSKSQELLTLLRFVAYTITGRNAKVQLEDTEYKDAFFSFQPSSSTPSILSKGTQIIGQQL